MLNPKELKVGSVVKVTMEILSLGSGGIFNVLLPDKTKVWLQTSALYHAELVKQPEPTFTKEQVAAIKEVAMKERIASIDNTPCLPLEAWLDSHTETQD